MSKKTEPKKAKREKPLSPILNISMRTVEFHKYLMMHDLGLNSAAELIRFAYLRITLSCIGA